MHWVNSSVLIGISAHMLNYCPILGVVVEVIVAQVRPLTFFTLTDSPLQGSQWQLPARLSLQVLPQRFTSTLPPAPSLYIYAQPLLPLKHLSNSSFVNFHAQRWPRLLLPIPSGVVPVPWGQRSRGDGQFQLSPANSAETPEMLIWAPGGTIKC